MVINSPYETKYTYYIHSTMILINFKISSIFQYRSTWHSIWRWYFQIDGKLINMQCTNSWNNDSYNRIALINFYSDIKFLSFCFNIDGIFRRLPKQATNRQIFIKNVSSKYLRRWRNMSRYFTKQVIICLESLGYCKWLFPW